MLCVSLTNYQRACSSVTGGVSDILFFDPSDFNFTQATATSAYSAVSLRDGATADGGALMYAVSFNEDEADRAWAHTVKGCSVKYEHTLSASLPQLSNLLTNFLSSLDAAGCCCGLGLMIRHRDGKIFVMGEKYVNGTQISKFTVKMSGSDGSTGRLYDDPNGANIKIVGTYSRDLREYSGSWDSIEALTAGNTPGDYDTDFSFASSTTAEDAGIAGTATATNANLAFSFNAITPQEGTPLNMTINVGSVFQLSIDFPSDYLGETFSFTDTAGITHSGVFQNGTQNF